MSFIQFFLFVFIDHPIVCEMGLFLGDFGGSFDVVAGGTISSRWEEKIGESETADLVPRRDSRRKDDQRNHSLCFESVPSRLAQGQFLYKRGNQYCAIC